MKNKIHIMEEKNRHLIKNTILIIIIISILPISLYFYKFHSGLSSNPTDWASFGSYIGGILGPIFSGLSLLVLSITFYHSKESDIKQMALAVAEQNLNKILEISKTLKESISSKDYYSAMLGDSDFNNYMKRIEDHLSTYIAMRHYKTEEEYWHQYKFFFKASKIDLSDELNLLLEAYHILDNSDDGEKPILRSTFNSTVSKEMRFLLCLYGLNNADGFEELCSKWSGFKTIPWEINYPDETEQSASKLPQQNGNPE
ncbi:hypothetical protein ACJ8PZ_18555 [Serratia sp. CY83950]|uniref:hypothetical protein n=1 Tax=Serratia sp. CY83950 TaxID=3383692 RepID=UPI003FA06F87